MLTILGQARRHCDGLSRREFLAAGAVGLGGLTLADLLRVEAVAGLPAYESAKRDLDLIKSLADLSRFRALGHRRR